MNAYELAEKLYLSSYDTYHEEAAALLRQQADRIAELENDLEGCEYFLKEQTKPLSDEEIIDLWGVRRSI